MMCAKRIFQRYRVIAFISYKVNVKVVVIFYVACASCDHLRQCG